MKHKTRKRCFEWIKLAVLPLVYIVNRQRDLRIGIATHWLLNTLGSFEWLVAIFR